MGQARLALLAAIALVACREAATPEEVALEFWTAAAARDFKVAAPFSTASRPAEVKQSLGSFAPTASPAIGEALMSENHATVETIFLGSGASQRVAFETHLVLVDGGWRVDLPATADELGLAQTSAGDSRALGP